MRGIEPSDASLVQWKASTLSLVLPNRLMDYWTVPCAHVIEIPMVTNRNAKFIASPTII